jgi:hypothetical protein
MERTNASTGSVPAGRFLLGSAPLSNGGTDDSSFRDVS